jgi:hypothetical protein
LRMMVGSQGSSLSPGSWGFVGVLTCYVVFWFSCRVFFMGVLRNVFHGPGWGQTNIDWLPGPMVHPTMLLPLPWFLWIQWSTQKTQNMETQLMAMIPRPCFMFLRMFELPCNFSVIFLISLCEWPTEWLTSVKLSNCQHRWPSPKVLNIHQKIHRAKVTKKLFFYASILITHIYMLNGQKVICWPKDCPPTVVSGKYIP